MIAERSTGLSTDQKGAVAETAIALAAIALGLDVHKSLSDGSRADLVIDLGHRLARVQCKWAPLQHDVVIVRCYSAGRTAQGLKRVLYTAEEIGDRCVRRRARSIVLHSRITLRRPHATPPACGAKPQQPAEWGELG